MIIRSCNIAFFLRAATLQDLTLFRDPVLLRYLEMPKLRIWLDLDCGEQAKSPMPSPQDQIPTIRNCGVLVPSRSSRGIVPTPRCMRHLPG